MNLSASIFNYTLTFTPPSGSKEATLTWNEGNEPQIVNMTNYALITMSLRLNGEGSLSWVSDPINWFDPDTKKPITTPSSMTIRRENDMLCTIIDFNTTADQSETFGYTVSMDYDGQIFSFEPTIVNIKPGG